MLKPLLVTGMQPLKRVNEEKLLKTCWLAVGADEAGRGPLCMSLIIYVSSSGGPVVVAAAYVPKGTEDYIDEIRDSKELDEEQRDAGYDKLMKVPGFVYAYEVLDEVAIDSINILASSMLGMARCSFRIAAAMKNGVLDTEASKAGAVEAPDWGVHQLDDLMLVKSPLLEKFSWEEKPLGILIDGPRMPACLKARAEGYSASEPDFKEVTAAFKKTPAVGLPIIKGDATEVSIAAASIVAKVVRDRLMVELSAAYPGWNFEGHKGYPCPEHKSQLVSKPPTKTHRWSFGPVLESLVKFGYMPKSVLSDKDDKAWALSLRRTVREKGLDEDGAEPGALKAFMEVELARLRQEKEEAKKKAPAAPKAKAKAKAKAAPAAGGGMMSMWLKKAPAKEEEEEADKEEVEEEKIQPAVVATETAPASPGPKKRRRVIAEAESDDE